MKVSAKFTILGYIGTYYAIGASLPLSIANYFLTGWIAADLDHSYLPSWDMLCGTLFIFVIVSPIAFAWYRHRLGDKKFLWALLEAFMWMPFFGKMLIEDAIQYIMTRTNLYPRSRLLRWRVLAYFICTPGSHVLSPH